MNLIGGIAIFFVTWWLCLFVMLPFGVRSQHEESGRMQGTDPGAPLRPLLLRKMAATTILAAIIFAALYVYFDVYNFSLEDLVLGARE